MQNFYGNNKAEADNRQTRVTYVGNSCEDNFVNVRAGRENPSSELQSIKRSENIINTGDERGTFRDLISKISDYIKSKAADCLKRKEAANVLMQIKDFGFDTNITEIVQTVSSHAAEFFKKSADMLSGIVKIPFQKKTRVKIIAGGTTLMLVCAICVTANAAGYKLGYEVSINGETIGTVVNQDEAIAAVDSAKETITQVVGEEVLIETSLKEAEPEFSRTIVAPNTVVSAEEIENTILSSVDGMVECTVITVNGSAVVGLTSREDADFVLKRFKAQYMPEVIADDMIVEFSEQVEVKSSFLSPDMIKDIDGAFKILNEHEELVDYTIQSKDTLWNISKRNGMTIRELKEVNPELNDKIRIGDTIKVKAIRPLVSVKITETTERNENIPFETETVYSDELYIGDKEITTEGVEGQAVVLSKSVFVNGVEESSEVIDKIVTVDPITRVETVGTKELPKAATGTFARPTTGGKLSSTFGGRWGRNHNGIDISMPCNNTVYASDGGVVTYSGWMSGYGNYITIDHQNGYQTCYAHNNQLCVSVGQKVAKGEKIALSGNTGNSTGPHLHFEVKKNGVFQNPLNYVKY